MISTIQGAPAQLNPIFMGMWLGSRQPVVGAKVQSMHFSNAMAAMVKNWYGLPAPISGWDPNPASKGIH